MACGHFCVPRAAVLVRVFCKLGLANWDCGGYREYSWSAPRLPAWSQGRGCMAECQRPRRPLQTALNSARTGVHSAVGSLRVPTYILKATRLPEAYPAGFVFPKGKEANQASYYDRGWCFFESSAASAALLPSLSFACSISSLSPLT